LETKASIFQSAAAPRRTLATFIGLTLCLSIIGCGGSSSSTPTLSSLAVTPANQSITMGNTQQMTATATYSNGSTANLTSSVTWSSSAAGVATVGTGGLATSVATGSTTVSASSGGLSANTTLTVTPALVSIDVTPATSSIPVNGTQQFTAIGTYSDNSTQDLTKTAHWSSSSAGVATINNGISGGAGNRQSCRYLDHQRHFPGGEREHHSHRELNSTAIRAGNGRVSFLPPDSGRVGQNQGPSRSVFGNCLK
jgi:hypothetical protein